MLRLAQQCIGLAMFLVSFSHESTCFVTPSGLLARGLGNKMSVSPLASSRKALLRPARAGVHSRTICRFETGPGGPHRFPAPGSDNTWIALPKIYVLLFNPRTENEGIYTLQITPKDGIMQNTVVLFEDQDDATRFAGLLEAQDFPMSHVEGVEPSEIEAFTAEAGYQTSFIPAGTLFLPPETNVGTSEMRLPSMPWHANMDEDWSELDLDLYDEDADEFDDTDYNAVRRHLEDLFNA